MPPLFSKPFQALNTRIWLCRLSLGNSVRAWFSGSVSTVAQKRSLLSGRHNQARTALSIHLFPHLSHASEVGISVLHGLLKTRMVLQEVCEVLGIGHQLLVTVVAQVVNYVRPQWVLFACSVLLYDLDLLVARKVLFQIVNLSFENVLGVRLHD